MPGSSPVVEGRVESRRLGPIIEGCEGLAFVVPRVAFGVRGERWRSLRPDEDGR